MGGYIVHIKKEKYDIYIGRTYSKFHYGNPFTHKKDTLAKVILSSREEAVNAYREWLSGEKYQEIEPERRSWILEHLPELKNKILGCWCAPKLCHGSILIEFINLI